MGRHKITEPLYEPKRNVNAARIQQGMIDYGKYPVVMPTSQLVLPATPDLSGASVAQDTVVRNREYYHEQAYLHSIPRMVQHISSPARMYRAIAVMLLAYEPPQYEDSPAVSAFRGHTAAPQLKLQPGYEPYVTGKDYPKDAHMALYDKGTGKFLFGGTKQRCNEWLMHGGPKRTREMRKRIRIEVKVL